MSRMKCEEVLFKKGPLTRSIHWNEKALGIYLLLTNVYKTSQLAVEFHN